MIIGTALKKIGLGIAFSILLGCGPVVYTTRSDLPPPAWFYPNRLEVVRYVYFPEYQIYFDLSRNQYIYLNAGSWTRVSILPPRYRNIDLRRSRYERVQRYRSEDIQKYHQERNMNRGRSNKTTKKRPANRSSIRTL